MHSIDIYHNNTSILSDPKNPSWRSSGKKNFCDREISARPRRNTAEYRANTASFHTVRVPGLPDWVLVANIRFHPRTGIFLPLPPLRSLLLLFLPSHPSVSFLLDTSLSSLSLLHLSLFATFTMAKGDVTQGDKSFMGMPVSVSFLSLHRSTPLVELAIDSELQQQRNISML